MSITLSAPQTMGNCLFAWCFKFLADLTLRVNCVVVNDLIKLHVLIFSFSEMTLWNLEDGHCIEYNKSNNVHMGMKVRKTLLYNFAAKSKTKAVL